MHVKNIVDVRRLLARNNLVSHHIDESTISYYTLPHTIHSVLFVLHYNYYYLF